MANAIATPEQQLLNAKRQLKQRVDKIMPQIAASVPRHIQPDSMARFLFNAINANPDIALKCTPQSICDCLVRAAARGLEISDGMLGDCHLVPFGSEAVLVLSYKGIKKLVRQSGQGVVIMDHVREGDTFEDRGPVTSPVHRKSHDADRHKRPVVAAYASMAFTNGITITKVMTIGELKAHRAQYVNARNFAKPDKPWHEDNVAFSRMCEKTCVRQLASSGDLPLSSDDRTLLASDEDLASIAAVAEPPQRAIAEPAVIEARIENDELEAAVGSCRTALECDDLGAKLRSNYPGSAQEIYDAFSAKRELLLLGGAVVVDENGEVT